MKWRSALAHGGRAFSQRGNTTLIGMLLATTIAAGALPWIAEQQQRRITDEMATTTGHDLAQFAAGLRGFIAAAQSNPSIIPAAPQTGTNWLRPPTCGGLPTNPPTGYIPCHFARYGTRDTLFDADFQTTITRNADTNYIEARTTFVPRYPSDPAQVGNIADKIVNTALAEVPTPANGMFTNYLSNVPVTANDLTQQLATMNNQASPDFGRVLLIASNAPSQDLWLRVDGTNQMLANLNMGGNDLINARNVKADGYGVFGGGIVAGDDIITSANVIATDNVAGNNQGIVLADDVLIRDALINNGYPRLSKAVFDVQDIPTGSEVIKPTCPPGSTPQVFASPSYAASSTNYAMAIHAIRVQAVDLGTTWRIDLKILTSDGWAAEDKNVQRVMVMTKCS